LHSSSNIISDEIRQDGVGEMKIAYKRSIWKPKGKRLLGRLGIDGRQY